MKHTYRHISINRLLALLLAGVIAFGVLDCAPEAFTAMASETQSTAQASKKRSSRKKSSRKKSTRKSGTKKKKKGTRKSSSAQKAPVAPPQDPVCYDSLTLLVNSAILANLPENMNAGGLRVNSVKPDARNRQARLSLNENFTYLPITNEFIKHLQQVAKDALPDSIADYSISLSSGNHNLSYYITKVDKLPEQYRKNVPFVVAAHPYVNPVKGMEGDIVALWHSHGRYYKNGAWQWQRPLLFETVEDVYTMSYVLPYIAPMLENAGAYVMLPRERDTNRHEVIVDNDRNDGGEIYSQPYYKEMQGSRKWETGEFDGFIYDLKDFRDTENPFEVGTYRQTTTVRSGQPAVAAWYADIPADGEYAVYVSYKSLPNSTEDAHYTVNYSGGSREFRVNQTMGGSTWIYLGTFPLEAGYSDTEPVVTLTNISEKASDKIVTADAVKIGGGMGNIARSPRRSDVFYDPSTPENDLASVQKKTVVSEDDESALDYDEDDDEEGDDEGDDEEGDDEEDENDSPENTGMSPTESPAQPVEEKRGVAPQFRTSGYPRYLEGSRYWLHWAGCPESVYSPYHGSNDYKDDYTSRANWVNYLAGGSRVLPNRKGLNIPVDMAMALHSDAGKRADDSFVGTLGIFYTQNGDSYADGTPRINSRMLTDMLMRQITQDIRQTYEPRWTRRSMWDKSYVEARVPEVPTSLIELLSHQNYADMMYGLDPGFRFTVSRAIYKAMARFMGERKDREVVIQPLPVRDFMIRKEGKQKYRLQWEPTPDPLEPTAMPDKYIILSRTEGDLGFHKIGTTSATHFDVKVADDAIHSFKVVAANEGGLSFPSEVLALRDVKDEKTPVLIINGFTRVSGPAHFTDEGQAGFDSEKDFGVPYIKDISFTGHQTEFHRGAGESFGRSGSSYATQIIAGNTFDYPAVHGEAIAAAGHGFVSASLGAVEKGDVNISDFKTVDLILGKQKTTTVGNGKSGKLYPAFPEKLQWELRKFLDKGGNLFVSGQYVASDLFYPFSAGRGDSFGREVLGIEPGTPQGRTRSGRVQVIPTDLNTGMDLRTYSYSNTLNEDLYIVENPDVLIPSIEDNGQVLMEFTDTGDAAAVAWEKGRSKGVVMSVPFESIKDAEQRNTLMKQIIGFFE